MRKFFTIVATLCALGPVTNGPACAQQVKKGALEKTQWHVAPLEYQIIDDRPVVKDFREAPQDAGTVDLGGNGARQGAGAGLPAGGVRVGGGARHVESGLPKSGFGSSNIPARGLGAGNALPMVGRTNMGSLAHAPGKAVAPGKTASVPRSTSSAPAARSYGGGYSTAPTVTSGSSLRTNTNVKGNLLNKNVRGHLLNH